MTSFSRTKAFILLAAAISPSLFLFRCDANDDEKQQQWQPLWIKHIRDPVYTHSREPLPNEQSPAYSRPSFVRSVSFVVIQAKKQAARSTSQDLLATTVLVAVSIMVVPHSLAATKRLRKELQVLTKQKQQRQQQHKTSNDDVDDDDYVRLQVREDNLLVWKAWVRGPPDTPYEGGVFELDIRCGSDYPLVPPAIKFVTKVCTVYYCIEGEELKLGVVYGTAMSLRARLIIPSPLVFHLFIIQTTTKQTKRSSIRTYISVLVIFVWIS